MALEKQVMTRALRHCLQVEVPTVEVDAEALRKKQLVGFFGSPAKVVAAGGRGKPGARGRGLLGKADSMPLQGRCTRERAMKVSGRQADANVLSACIADPASVSAPPPQPPPPPPLPPCGTRIPA